MSDYFKLTVSLTVQILWSLLNIPINILPEYQFHAFDKAMLCTYCFCDLTHKL